MTELSIEQCRPYLLGILSYVDTFCRENNIEYSLGYGSLIGAIRHKGFIPWDDDIDIIMTRDNYNKFIELHKYKKNENERYRIRKGYELANHLHAVVSDEETIVIFQEGTTDSKFYKGGLWVDLFPLDNCCNELSYEKKWTKIRQLRKMQLLADFGALRDCSKWNRRIRNIIHPFMYPFSGLISRCLNRVILNENSCDTNYVASYSVWYWKQKVIPKSFFDNLITVEFEGYKYLAINEFDRYLRDLYGNYMQFPPEIQRVPKHKYKAFVKKI